MINISKLTLYAGQNRAQCLVRDLEWDILGGQGWCIVGRNGAGKSTLLRAIAGFDANANGHIQLQGRPLDQWDLEPLARMRAYLPQRTRDAFSFPVIDHVLAARHPYRDKRYWESDHDREIAREALRSVDALQFEQRDIRSLSGGERQRVAIATMLAQQTPVMLFDEPGSALDMPHQVQMMQMLGKAATLDGKAVVTVCHDLNYVGFAASHILMLMPDGQWCAGSFEDMMNADLLSQCFGHRIEVVEVGGKRFFMPAQ